MNAENFAALIHELGERIELEGLSADEDGYCGLQFDDTIDLHIQNREASGEIRLFSSPGRLDEAIAAEGASRLLEANRFWSGTGGATLGWDPASREVQLAYAIPAADLGLDRFLQVIETFVDNLENWQQRIEAWNRGEFDEAAPQASDSAGDIEQSQSMDDALRV